VAHELSQFPGQRNRVDGVRGDRVGLCPGRQPAVVSAAGDQQHWRAVIDLVLRLPADADTAGRLGLAVEHHHVNPALVEQPEQGGRGGDLDDLGLRHVRGWLAPDRQAHFSPGIGVVAVHNDLHGVNPTGSVAG
jgi:hypothetical protein